MHKTDKKTGLSKLDFRILNKLSQDPLASNRDIAVALDVPLNQVISSTRKLDRRKISRVIALMDLKASGQSFCFVFIEVRGRNVDVVATEIGSIQETLLICSLGGGPYDLLIALRFTDMLKLNDLMFHTICTVEGVYRTCLSMVLDVLVFPSPYLTPGPGSNFLSYSIESCIHDLSVNYDESVIDGMDRCIIAELQQNGRKSTNAIARKYKISASTIRYRIRSLESRGLMRFVTVIDSTEIGLEAHAIIEVRVMATHISSVLEELKNKSWVSGLFLCSGPTTIMATIQADSIETANRIKNEVLACIEGIIDVYVTMFQKTYKFDIRWGQKLSGRSGIPLPGQLD